MRLTRFIQSGLLVSAFFLLAGCGDAKNYDVAVNSWRGAPESALPGTWGTPEQVNQLKNGNHVNVYRTIQRGTGEKYVPNVGRVTTQPGGMMHSSMGGVDTHEPGFFCETEFEINPHGTIVDVNYSGNNCVATENRAKHWAYP